MRAPADKSAHLQIRDEVLHLLVHARKEPLCEGGKEEEREGWMDGGREG